MMKELITKPKWALGWIKTIEPDLDMLEICKKDEEVYKGVLTIILQER